MKDAKEHELIDERDEADCEWAKAYRYMAEANSKRPHGSIVEPARKLPLARRKWVEADRKLWKYRESKAQQGGKAGG